MNRIVYVLTLLSHPVVRRLTFQLCFLSSICFLPHSAANSASFVINDKGQLIISGSIVEGDYDRLYDLLKSHHSGDVGTVLLNSPGGKVLEAVKIGRLIRRLYLSTGGPSQVMPGTCASACVLIWFGGVQRFAEELDIHRISYDQIFFGSLSPSEATRKYNEGLAIVKQYMQEMGVPTPIYEKMINVPSALVYRLRLEELQSMAEEPSFNEWLISQCGSYNITSRPAQLNAFSNCAGQALIKGQKTEFTKIFGK